MQKYSIKIHSLLLIVTIILTSCDNKISLYSPINIVNQRCEYLSNPLGIDVLQPRLSWELVSEERDQSQTAYRILVASDPSILSQEKGDLWDSKKVSSSQTNQITYIGKPLKANQHCFWKVKVWDKNGETSNWSNVSYWSMGLLDRTDWLAKWIGPEAEQISKEQQYYINHGYRSPIASSPDDKRWVIVDLGENYELNKVCLYPVVPLKAGGWNTMLLDKSGKVKTYLFPKQFKVDISEYEDFREFKTVADETAKDYLKDNANTPYVNSFTPEKARYVRVSVPKLTKMDKASYAFALAELEVYGNAEKNLALNKPVTESGKRRLSPDSFTCADWSAKILTDGFLKANTSLLKKPFVPPSPLLRKEFKVKKNVEKAMLYATALGVYEMRMNGEKVGDHILTPEWTDYHTRIQYQAYDVTSLLNEGENVMGAMLADGWYAGPQFTHHYRGSYGFDRRLLAQLEISYSDGTNEKIVTDGRWAITDKSPIREASIWDGEKYDATFEQKGWDKPDYDDSSWEKAVVDNTIEKELNAQMNEPIKAIEKHKPIDVFRAKNGAYIFDVGQNLAGWAGISLSYNPKQKIVLRFGEMLDKDSTLYTLNLGTAEQTDTYTPGKEATIEYEPRFTYHGFRYVEVSGLTQPPSLDNLTVKVIASSSPSTGSFETSHPGVNKLWYNILWTQRSNMHSVPTDCPQRDERAGWMGDAQVFSQTAIFNLDMAAFFTKWIRDIRDSQTEDGRFPDFAPQVGVMGNFYNAPGWADAGVIVPWKMYQNYHDTAVLAEQYTAMKKFIDHVYQFNPDFIWRESRGNLYGDWLNGNTIVSDDYPKTGGKVPDDVYATAFWGYSTRILAEVSKLLDNEEDARYYSSLAQEIRQAFIEEFINDDGKIKGNTQAGYALALEFDLVPEALKPKAAAHMVESVKAYDYRMSTGIQSTIRLMNQLSANGYNDIAYRLLESRRFPSWLYSVDQGATTIWERWDGYVADRGFQNSGMNSFNHVAIGAVGEWMYRNILGINYNKEFPGYSHFTVKPVPGGSLTWAKGTYHSIAGDIGVSWKKEADSFIMDIEVPVNTVADVYLPTENLDKVTEGGVSIKENKEFEFISSTERQSILKVGSGKYSFEITTNE